MDAQYEQRLGVQSIEMYHINAYVDNFSEMGEWFRLSTKAMNSLGLHSRKVHDSRVLFDDH